MVLKGGPCSFRPATKQMLRTCYYPRRQRWGQTTHEFTILGIILRCVSASAPRTHTAQVFWRRAPVDRPRLESLRSTEPCHGVRSSLSGSRREKRVGGWVEVVCSVGEIMLPIPSSRKPGTQSVVFERISDISTCHQSSLVGGRWLSRRCSPRANQGRPGAFKVATVKQQTSCHALRQTRISTPSDPSTRAVGRRYHQTLASLSALTG